MDYELMTREEMARRYPEEWVLVLDPEPDDDQPFERGKVIFHSPHRQEITPHATTLPKPARISVFFLGDPTRGLPVLLNLRPPRP